MRILTLLSFLVVVNANASTKRNIDQLHDHVYTLFKADLDSAMDLAMESLELSIDEDYRWGIGNSHFIIGYIHRKNNNLTKAFYSYLKASTALDELNDEKSIKTKISILINCGSILRKYYKYHEAVEIYDRGLNLAGVDHPSLRLDLHYNKAHALQKKGHLDSAIVSLNEAVSLAQILKNQDQLNKCKNLLGLIHFNNKDYQAARVYYNQILSSPFSTKKSLAQANHNMAISYVEENNPDMALIYFEKALV